MEALAREAELSEELDNGEDLELEAPVTEEMNAADEDILFEENSSDVLYQPHFDPNFQAFLPESEQEYDIGQDLDIARSNVQTLGAVTTKMCSVQPHELDAKLRRLNHQQRMFLHHVLRITELNENSHQLFLTGGPGVGKSAVLKVLRLCLDDIFGRELGEWVCRHVSCAFTGAACNVLGRGAGTIHATFGVPINKALEHFVSLSREMLTKLRSQLLHLKWIIIDEASLIGNKMYNFINWRMQEIKQNNLPFAGVNILNCGDLSQLPPVGSAWIFQDMNEGIDRSDNDYEPPKKKTKFNHQEQALFYFSENLWKQHVKSYELDTIMRTKHKEFAGLQHRIRNLRHTGKNKLEKMLPEDVNFLNTFCKADIESDDYDPLSLHIFYKNQEVTEHNAKALHVLCLLYTSPSPRD